MFVIDFQPNRLQIYDDFFKNANLCMGNTNKKGHPKAARNSIISNHYLTSNQHYVLLLEIAVVQSLEALSVTSLILGHFVHSIVDSVEIELLCTLSDSVFV